MVMKKPPHPGAVVLQECIEPLGLHHHAGCRCTWRNAEYPVGTGERKARHLS